MNYHVRQIANPAPPPATLPILDAQRVVSSLWFAARLDAFRLALAFALPLLIQVPALCVRSISPSGSSGILHTAVEVASAAFPTAINLEEIKLNGFNFAFGKHILFAVQLLKKSPKLLVLEINIQEGFSAADSELLENTIHDDLRMLETVKLNGFGASEIELRLVKLLLSKSPALHHVVIDAAQSINDPLHIEATKKLLNFHRASPTAKIVYHLRGKDLLFFLNGRSTNP